MPLFLHRQKSGFLMTWLICSTVLSRTRNLCSNKLTFNSIIIRMLRMTPDSVLIVLACLYVGWCLLHIMVKQGTCCLEKKNINIVKEYDKNYEGYEIL